MRPIRFVHELIRDEDGVTAIEYAIVLGLVALGLTVAATTLGGSMADELGDVGNLVSALITP